MNPVIQHLLFIALVLIACLAVILTFPESLEAFGAKFWDAALWVGGCFS